HARHFVEAGEAAIASASGGAEPHGWIRLEAENLLAVARSSAVEPDLVARGALVLDRLLSVSGPFETRLHLLERAESILGSEADPELRARVLLSLADARLVQSSFAEARGLLERAAVLARSCGAGIQADILTVLGNVEIQAGRYTEARSRLAEAIGIARASKA